MKLLEYNKGESKHLPVPVEADTIKVHRHELKVLSNPVNGVSLELYHRGTGSTKDSKGRYVDVYA